jgi:hypothetical protein
MTLEERNGVFHFRKSRGTRKANTFHTPRRGRGTAGAPGAPSREPDGGAAPAGVESLLASSRKALPEKPELARKLALDAIGLACDGRVAWPPAYLALAAAEEALGRGAFARQIREAMELYASGR